MLLGSHSGACLQFHLLLEAKSDEAEVHGQSWQFNDTWLKKKNLERGGNVD